MVIERITVKGLVLILKFITLLIMMITLYMAISFEKYIYEVENANEVQETAQEVGPSQDEVYGSMLLVMSIYKKACTVVVQPQI